MPLPAPGPAPTGNALSDANSQLAVDPVAAAAAINTVNQQQASVASDCLWPPSAQITVPIIPGLFSQSISIPCLVSYSEARALVGAGLLGLGLFAMFGGVQLMVVAAAAPYVIEALGVRAGVRSGIRGAMRPAPAPKQASKSDMTEAA